MKVLIVGLGGIGQRHVRNLRTLLGSGVHITAYRVRGLDKVLTEDFQIEPERNIQEKYHIRAYENLDEALAQKPEVTFICNPTSLHLPIAFAASRAGAHLFIEKPLAHNYEDVDELIALVERKRLIGLVGYQMRFHPCLQTLRSLLEQRAVGRILSVRVEVGEYLPRWHPYEDYRQMYASRSDLGGGVILSQIHELDYIYWLFGLPRRLFAVGGHLSNLEIDVEDTASILMECVIEGKAVPIHVVMDYIQKPPSRTCQVIGESGKILLDFHSLKLQVVGCSGEIVESKNFEGFQRNEMFIAELEHLLSCLKGKESPKITIRDGAQSLRMALAAKESLMTGRAVELN